MLAFWISFAFAAFEMFLLFQLTISLAVGRKKLAFLIALLKAITYAVAMWLFIFNYFKFIVWCFSGFTVGIPLSALILYILKLVKSKKHR